jgi:hypothetical protein
LAWADAWSDAEARGSGGTSVEEIRRILAGEEDYEPDTVYRPVWGEPWARVDKVRKIDLPQFAGRRQQIQRISRHLAGQVVEG